MRYAMYSRLQSVCAGLPFPTTWILKGKKVGISNGIEFTSGKGSRAFAVERKFGA